MSSTTPVLKSAAEMTKKLVSVMITGSPNPRKASAGVMTRPSARVSSARSATMSIGSASVTNRIIASSRTMKTNAIATLIAQYLPVSGARRRAASQQIEDSPDHVVERSRLGDAEIRARTDPRWNFIAAVAGDDNDRNPAQGAIGAKFSEHPLAVDVRQVQVENYHVGREAPRRAIAGDAAGRRPRFAALGLEEMFNRFARIFIVLDDQDAGLTFLHRFDPLTGAESQSRSSDPFKSALTDIPLPFNPCLRRQGRRHFSFVICHLSFVIGGLIIVPNIGQKLRGSGKNLCELCAFAPSRETRPRGRVSREGAKAQSSQRLL